VNDALRSTAFPVRFRRRIAIAFVVVAGISAGALAVGASVAVYSYRTSTFRERAREQVRTDASLLAAGAAPAIIAERLAHAAEPGGPAVVVLSHGTVLSSVETVGLERVPDSLQQDARAHAGELVESRVRLPSGAALVVGTVDKRSAAEIYFFFPREELERSLRELFVTLGAGWLIVVATAGIAGTLIARRALRPVRTAADAARSVTEGLLDTRLPVTSIDEFGAWAAAFNEMVAALEAKIRDLAEARDREQRFAVDVAHELRTPIAALLTAASHLAASPLDDRQETHEIAEIVVSASRRLDRLTSELLELHRLESGHGELQLEDIDLANAVAQTIRAHGWQQRVRVDPAPTIVLRADRRRLERILVNIIGNAIHHGGAEVRAEIAREGAGATIAVSDDGPGISPEDLPHVFDRHYKVSSHRGDVRLGSGLGLSIAKESAELLGGTLTARSEIGAGATFTLWLPSAMPPLDHDDRVEVRA
jgi:two-component system sensor histidine kinase MtrB